MPPRKTAGHGPAKNQKEKKHVKGIIELTRKGVGYLPWPMEESASAKGFDETREDIEIANEKLRGALNGDEVEVALTGLFPRPKGEVVRVVTRTKEVFVCTLRQAQSKLWEAVPADQKFYRPITINPGTAELRDGTKVLVKLLRFDGTKDPEGEVVEVIGTAGEHRVEMNAIVLEHGFSTQFPPDTAKEAQKIEQDHANIISSQLANRTDFRGVPTMTIDPADAKDFDDALSIQTLPPPAGGGEPIYEIGVHIADVTFFVRPGTPLEREAQKRGTSVYLVDATIPMLPHELSGNVCSLKPDTDRLAFSAIFRMDKKGRVLERRFERSVIRSQKRFTYEEAQVVLDTGNGPFKKELDTLWSLAQILRAQREKAGAIDFGDNEVKFVLDKDGKPLGVVRKERINTNLLIEEFMLLANKEVATYVSDLAKKVPEKNYVFLYRIHDQPKEDRIDELATFVRAVGYDFGHMKKGGKKKITAKDIRKLLHDIEGTPEASLIRTATLRSMAKAIYSTKNIGHFGLSFEYYTHFTSPIRRYPDMLVHRILASHLHGMPISRHEYGHLEKVCIEASEREAKAVSAERDSIRYKQVEYMLGKIGQTFDAVISGVTDWGLYVEDTVTAAEGLVRVRTIGDDFYNYSAKEYALVGQRSKKKFALGDRLRVRLVVADLINRQLDFELVRQSSTLLR